MPAHVTAEAMDNGHGACCWMNDWKEVVTMLGGQHYLRSQAWPRKIRPWEGSGEEGGGGDI